MNRNEPAFPCEHAPTSVSGVRTWAQSNGLTKREHAAIQIVKGLLSNPKITEHPAFDKPGCVNEAIQYADALFDELEKEASNGK